MAKVTEGYLEFDAPGAGKECKTWYRVYGSLSSSKTPLLALHGGPGCPSEYLWPLEDLTVNYDIPVIVYDQIGGGRSTHLPEKNGDTDFWTVSLFLKELNLVIKSLGIENNYNLLGHSWGGMLGSEHAVLQPTGMKKLVISNSPAAIPLWIKVADKYLEAFPKEYTEMIRKHESDGTTDSEEYENGMIVFYKKHMLRREEWPELFMKVMQGLKEDFTVYGTMQGPSEFTITGSIKDWSIVGRANKINVPTLILNGDNDIADGSAVKPFLDEIKDSRLVTFEDCSHMMMFEEREKYIRTIEEFLRE